MLFCDLFCSRWCMKDKYKARLAKGEDRIERELDIAQFIKRQKRQFIAFKLLFTKMERYLIQNNRTFVLHGSCSSKSEESESDVVSSWDEGKDWNDQKSPYFEKLLELAKLNEKDMDETGLLNTGRPPNYTLQAKTNGNGQLPVYNQVQPRGTEESVQNQPYQSSPPRNSKLPPIVGRTTS